MKTAIRLELKQKRKDLVQSDVMMKSKMIIENLIGLKKYKRAKTLMLYYPYNNEVDILELVKSAISEGKNVVLPKMDREHLELCQIDNKTNYKKNKFGINEPEDSRLFSDYASIDLAIIPGVGFDKLGNRLGYGKGYFDKLLKEIKAYKIGLSYDFQLMNKVPSNELDVPVDMIITENEIIKPKVIDGNALSKVIYDNLRKKVDTLDRKPCLAVILVGENPASQLYVKIKRKKAENIGIVSKIYKLDSDATDQTLRLLISKLNNDPSCHGILVQLPLPKGLDQDKIINYISPCKDVDCLTAQNYGRFSLYSNVLSPCTPKGIIKLLESTGKVIEGKHAVVVGRSNIVGKPVAKLLLEKNATVTICHSRTVNLPDITKNADILVAATGVPNIITGEMIKNGAIVIDVGTNRVDGKLVGDVDFMDVKKKASFITPVPGGVGPMTVAMLMENTLICYDQLTKGEDNAK